MFGARLQITIVLFSNKCHKIVVLKFWIGYVTTRFCLRHGFKHVFKQCRIAGPSNWITSVCLDNQNKTRRRDSRYPCPLVLFWMDYFNVRYKYFKPNQPRQKFKTVSCPINVAHTTRYKIFLKYKTIFCTINNKMVLLFVFAGLCVRHTCRGRRANVILW